MAAGTVTNKKLFSVGNTRQVNFTVTLAAASSIVDTGLSYVEHIIATPKSMATASLTYKPNLSSSATAVNGRISINSGASGDDIFITCYGK